jgi:transposase
MMLSYATGETISAIARSLQTNRPKVERCIDKALQLGSLTALEDMPRKGRPARITPEARAWVVSLACQKPVDLGYPEELWTARLLASHVREHCKAAGHPSLLKLARGTVSKILSQQTIRPHKISYYLERRDPEFDQKMAQVLCIYKQVQVLHELEAQSDAPLTPPYSPPFRREGLSGPVAGAFCDRARRKRSHRYGEDARPSETAQTRGLTAPQ